MLKPLYICTFQWVIQVPMAMVLLPIITFEMITWNLKSVCTLLGLYGGVYGEHIRRLS